MDMSSNMGVCWKRFVGGIIVSYRNECGRKAGGIIWWEEYPGGVACGTR